MLPTVTVGTPLLDTSLILLPIEKKFSNHTELKNKQADGLVEFGLTNKIETILNLPKAWFTVTRFGKRDLITQLLLPSKNSFLLLKNEL